MATIQELLASLLNPNPGMSVNQLTGPSSLDGPNYLTQTGLGPEQLARYHQMSGMGGGAMPQAAPPAPVAAPQPQMPDQTQTASAGYPSPSGGGFLSGLLGGGGGGGENQTIQWLQGQGMDPGTATMMAKHKPALQAYLLKRSQGKEPIEINGRLVDPNTYEVLADFSDKSGGAKPAGIQEYEYAKAQGFPGTFADWEASKKGGMSLQVDPETGAVTFQQGGNIKPMTESQSKDTVFSTKAAGSLPIIDKFGDSLTSLGESIGGSVPVIGEYMKTEEYQQAEQAGQEFLMGVLRKETGAAITQEETQIYGDMYLPRPGDKPAKLAQKKASRARALEAIKAGMTPQAILAQEKALAAGGEGGGKKNATPEQLQAMPPPEGIEPGVWKFMKPEDRKLWLK